MRLLYHKRINVAPDLDLDYVSISGNAAAPLTTPTYDTSGQVVHPSVYYNAAGWNGHKYWMAITPYPNGNNVYENPSILVSEDGITWVVPDGVTNPIEAKPDGGFNADPNLIMGLDGKLYLYFSQIISGVGKVYLRSSTDGITWTAKQEVLFNTPGDCGAVSVFIEGTTYVMYYVRTADSPNVLKRSISSSPLGTWSDPVTCTITGMPVGREAWHVEVKKFLNHYHAFLVAATGTENGSGSILYFAESYNGIDWTMKDDALVGLSAGWQDSMIYKASGILFNSGDNYYYKLWYSAMSTAGAWRLGLTTVYLTNKPPTDIALSPNSIDENNGIGDIIGEFSTTDPDAGNTFTYELVAGTGDTNNDKFTIDGANLKAGIVFNYETKSSYSIRVKSTDQGGFSVEKQFTVTINYVPNLLDSLISVWEMDETAGAVAYDSHGDNDLAITGAVINQDGKIGKAFSYNASADYLNSAARIITSYPYSVSAWVKIGANTINTFNSNRHASSYYGVKFEANYNVLTVTFGDGGGLNSNNRKTYQLANSLTVGNWYHVVLTVTAHGVFTCYVDTVVKSIPYLSGSATATSFAAGTFYIGDPTWSPNGLIDQVAIWNKALSAEEVALLFNSGNGLAYSEW